jgi:rod shape-determining protein MreD
MRGLISFVAVAVAVVCQLTIVDKIAFPGGAGPDLVLVLVAALALATGPLAGALIGFWAGLALDVAPPGSHFTGQNALVFCLVGYVCGLLADEPSGDGVTDQGHTALFEIVVVAVGAILGEALVALLGVMLSDPRVTWPAITHVLPVAAAYDAVACPFVLFAAAAALRLAGASKSRDESRRPASARIARTALPGAGPGAGRPVGAGSTPRLRLSAGKGEGWIAGPRGQGAPARPALRREPRLKLGRGMTPGATFATGGSLRGSSLRGSSLRGGSPRGSSLGGGLASSGLARTRMGRSLLGGSVFSRTSPALTRTSSLTPHVSPARTNLLGRSLVPRFSRGRALSRLTGALRRSARPRSPGKGWLRGTSPRSGGGAPSGAALGRRAFKGNTLKGSTFKGSTFKGSAFKGSTFKGGAPKGKAFKGGAFKIRGSGTTLGRGFGAGKGGLRSGGPARLRMPRRRKAWKRSWRTGGYR